MSNVLVFLGFEQVESRDLMVLTGDSGEQHDRGKDLINHFLSCRILSGLMKRKGDLCVIEGKLAISV